jgi:PAS domain-containing protein
MDNGSDVRDWDEGFARELADLQRRIDGLRSAEADGETFDTLLQDLETAHEELRAADAEVRAQQDELSRLVHSQRVGRWQYERLAAILPAPVLTTDAQGIIASVNAAAATLLNLRVDRILRKPIQAFVQSPDRMDLRRSLTSAVHSRQGFRQVVGLLPREHDGPVQAEVVVKVTPTTDLRVEVTWMLLPVRDRPDLPAYLDRTSLAGALVDLAALPLHRADATVVIEGAAAICSTALGETMTVSIRVGPPGEPEIAASESRLAQTIDTAQVDCGQGPAHDAWTAGSSVTSQNLSTDGRWPRLARRVRSVGAVGAVASPIRIGDQPVGVLQVFAQPEPVDETVVEAAELFSAGVAAILHEVGLKAELEELATDLQQSLRSRSTIDQAKGIIMSDRGCTPEEAFEHLVRLSSTTNVKLRDIAAGIVDGTWRPPDRRPR